jgi:trimeric autotransporter adhesin
MRQSDLNGLIKSRHPSLIRSPEIARAKRCATGILTFAQLALAGLVAMSAAPLARASIPAAQYYFDADGLQNSSDAVTVLFGTKALAAGAGAHALGVQSIAFGFGAGAMGNGGIAIGSGSTAFGADAIALGNQTLATASGAFAGGLQARAERLSTAVGAYSAATGDTSSAFGASSRADGIGAVALGGSASATNRDALAAGHMSNAAARDAVALGGSAAALGERAIAVGTGAQALSDSGLAAGAFAAASDNATALGTSAGAMQTGATAVGMNAVANGTHATALGNLAGAGGTDSLAVGALSHAENQAVAIGAYANANARASLAFGHNAIATHENSIALGAGSGTTVGARTGYLAYGLSAPQTSVGEVNIGTRTISGVAAGAADLDAVNVAQLKALDSKIDAAAAQLVNTLSYASTADGAVDRNSVALAGDPAGGGTQIHNVANARDAHDAVNLGQLSTMLADAIASAPVNGGNSGSNPLFAAAGDSASETAHVGGAHSVAAGASAEALAAQSVAIGASSRASGTNALGIGANAFASNADAIAVGANTQASGAHSAALGSNARATGNHALALGATSRASADNSIALGYGSVADRANSVSIGADGNERHLTHVAPAIEGTDAVNLNQLNQTMNGSLAAANRYTDDKLRSVRRDAYGGAAAALAVAALPRAVLPGRGMVAMAGGSYGGQSALAFGVSQLSESGQWAYGVQGTASSRGEVGAALGAGAHF